MIFSQQTHSTKVDLSINISQNVGNQVMETQTLKKFSWGGPPDPICFSDTCTIAIYSLMLLQAHFTFCPFNVACFSF